MIKKVLICFLLSYSFAFTQQDSLELKNIYKEAEENIYKDPRKALSQIDILINNHQNDTKLLIDGYFLKSRIYTNLKENEKALLHLEKTYNFVKNTDDYIYKSTILHQIATVFQNLKLYDKSLFYLNEAEQNINLITNQEKKYRAKGYNFIIRGFIFKDLNNCESAINYFSKAIENYDKMSDKFVATSNKSVVYYNLGYCYLNTDLAAAKSSYEKSYSLAKESGTNILVAYSLKGLGEYYFKINDYKESDKNLKDALTYIQKDEDPLLKRNLYNLIALNAVAQQQWQEYDESVRLAYIYNRKLLDTENKSMYYAVQSIDKEAKNSLKKSFYITIITIALTISTTLIIMFLFFIKKKKNNLKEKELQQELQTLLNQ